MLVGEGLVGGAATLRERICLDSVSGLTCVDLFRGLRFRENVMGQIAIMIDDDDRRKLAQVAAARPEKVLPVSD